MDEGALREALERWREAGIIDGDTAQAIRDFEGETEGPPEKDGDRYGLETSLAGIVALMGAMLVGAGILITIGINWDRMGDITRTVVLIAIPTLTASAGVEFDRRGLGRVSRGVWVLAILMLGPVIWLLTDIHAPGTTEAWIFLLWGVFALPMAHAITARLGVAVGILALYVGVLLTGTGQTGLFVAGMLGAVVIAAARATGRQDVVLGRTYKLLGYIPAIGVFLWLATQEGRVEGIDVTIGVYLLLGGLAGGGAVAGTWWQLQGGRTRQLSTIETAVPLVASLSAVGLVELGPVLPSLVTYLLIQLVLLGMLLAIASLGVVLGSVGMINLVALGFMGQILTLLLTLTGELPGALALIVAGIILIIAAIALERGRRHALELLPGRADGVDSDGS